MSYHNDCIAAAQCEGVEELLAELEGLVFTDRPEVTERMARLADVVRRRLLHPDERTDTLEERLRLKMAELNEYAAATAHDPGGDSFAYSSQALLLEDMLK